MTSPAQSHATNVPATVNACWSAARPGTVRVVATLSAHVRPALVARVIELYGDWRTSKSHCAAQMVRVRRESGH